MTRLLLAVVLACCVVGSARAQEQDQVVELLDRTLFFADPAISDVQISPDARLMAFLAPFEGVLHLWVKTIHAPFTEARRLTGNEEDPSSSYHWSADSRFLLYLRDSGGDENFHLFAIAADTTSSAALEVRDLTPYGTVQTRIYSLAPFDSSGVVIVGLNDRLSQFHDVYRIDIASGNRELVLQNPGDVVTWIVNLAGIPVAATRIGFGGGTEIAGVFGDTIVAVYGCEPDETCEPIRAHRDGSRVFIASNRGDRGRTELELLNPRTLEIEPVHTDPEGRADLSGVLFAPSTFELAAVMYNDDRTRIYPVDTLFPRDHALLEERFPELELTFGAASSNGALQVLQVSGDREPGTTFLFDVWRGRVDSLSAAHPDMPREQLRPTTAIRYRSRDGSDIPALLTLPVDSAPAGLPAVIVPHDGPWERDRWDYDPLVQFLASRGYAVLQPNYRGSKGFGKAHESSGFRAWGTTAQTDLNDGIQYLVAEGIADPSRIAIVGLGYGGYAALMGASSSTARYAAAVAIGGPADLPSFLAELPPYASSLAPRYRSRVGDLDDPADLQRLEVESPIFMVNEFRAPVLLIHGVNNPIVNVGQSDRLAAALSQAGREVEYLRVGGEGRQFRRAENRLAIATAIESFLAAHLGGGNQVPALGAADPVLTRMADAGRAALGGALASVVLPTADGNRLRRGTLRYRLSTTDGFTIESVREIQRTSMNRRDIWRIIDSAMVPVYAGMQADTMLDFAAQSDPSQPEFEPIDLPPPPDAEEPAWDTVEVDRRTLLPIRRRTAGPISVAIDYSGEQITGEMQILGMTLPIDVAIMEPVFGDGPALELAIAGLPLRDGYEVPMRVFDIRLERVVPMLLRVQGREQVETPAGRFDAWRAELTPVSRRDAPTYQLLLMNEQPHYVIRSTVRVPGDGGGFSETTELIEIVRRLR